MQRLPRIVELLLALILCGVVAFWVVRLMRGETIAVPPTAEAVVATGNGRVDQVLASARLFGSRRPGALSDNVRALGVVADDSGRGSVIVSVDGQAPRVYRVGDTLDGRMVSAIRAEEIELEAGGARQVFRLPPARPSATGLTIIGSGTSAPGSPAGAQTDAYAPPPPMRPQPQLSMPPPMQQSAPGMIPGLPPAPPPERSLNQ